MRSDGGGGRGGGGRVTLVVITLIGIVTALVMIASVYWVNTQPGSSAPIRQAVHAP